jgi:hypothetical protein
MSTVIASKIYTAIFAQSYTAVVTVHIGNITQEVS